jgi:hypothetical protein
MSAASASPASSAETSRSSSQHATSTTWFKDDTGTFAEGWQERLPGELKTHASLKVMPSIEALAKSYVETKAMVGKRLERPGDNATAEQMAAWRKVAGAPEKPEGYLGNAKSVRPEVIPENLWDPAGEKRFLEIAHRHALPPAAVKDILAYYGESVAQSLTASQRQETLVLHREGAKLRQAWGQDFDRNLASAAHVAVTVGLDPKTDPIFTNAHVVQAFARMGRLLSEDKLVSGGAASIAMSLADRAQEITDPQSQSQLAREYRGEFGPERQQAAQEHLHSLYAAARQR